MNQLIRFNFCMAIFVTILSRPVQSSILNDLVGTNLDLFPPQLDDLISSSTWSKGPGTASAGVVGEVTRILGQHQNLDKIYKNYLDKQRTPGRGQEAHFSKNLLNIIQHNLAYENGQLSWQRQVNQYTDWSDQEIDALLRSYGNSTVVTPSVAAQLQKQEKFDTLATVPSSMDWRQSGIVTPPKDQKLPKYCGSCWSFAAIGTLEAAVAKKTGVKLDLSEQELLDCERTYSLGCNGGSAGSGLVYIYHNGIRTEAQYPYVASQGSTCRASGLSAAKIFDVQLVNNTEEAFKQAVATYGPIIVGVSIGNDWMQYGGGFYDGPCGTSGHVISLIGYGTTTVNGQSRDYWLVKDSQGTNWGEGGFMRLARGVNKCGIANGQGIRVIV